MSEFREPFERQREARLQAFKDAQSKLELADEQTETWPKVSKEIDLVVIPTLRDWIAQLSKAMGQPASLDKLHIESRRLQMMRGTAWRDLSVVRLRFRNLALRVRVLLAWLYANRRVIAEVILATLSLAFLGIMIFLMVRFLPPLVAELMALIRG